MLYNLLKDIRRQLEEKMSRTAQEQETLDRINRSIPHMRRDGDAEQLMPGEVLARICPDTGHPVLVCHDGQGRCACLHNETIGEDATDVKLWLSSLGRECNGNRKLLETVVDLAYNAGADRLWENRDSRAVVSDIICWAEEFETRHTDTGRDTKDYLLAIDKFYKEKISDL